MKTKIELTALVYTILTALKDAKEKNPLGGEPNGHLYAQLIDMVRIEEWEKIITWLMQESCIAQKNYFLTITEKGLNQQQKLQAVYDEMERMHAARKPQAG